MWTNLMTFEVPAANLVVRAVVVFIAVLILLRISGKRQVGQMGATEFVAVLLISNAVQNSMNGGDNSLIGGLLLAAVLIAMSYTITLLTFRSPFFSRLFEGTPRLLIHEGKLLEKSLSKERLSHAELRVLLRKQGVHFFKEVKTAVLEADGTISITRFSDLAPGQSSAQD